MNTPNGLWGDPDGYGDVSYSTTSNSFMTSRTPPPTAATYVPLSDQPTGSYSPPPLGPLLPSAPSSARSLSQLGTESAPVTPVARNPFLADTSTPTPPKVTNQALQNPQNPLAPSPSASSYLPMESSPAPAPQTSPSFPLVDPLVRPSLLGDIEPAPFAGGPSRLVANDFAQPVVSAPVVPASLPPTSVDSAPSSVPREPIDVSEPLSVAAHSDGENDAALFGPSSFGVLAGTGSTSSAAIDPASTSHIPRINDDPNPTTLIAATRTAAHEPAAASGQTNAYQSDRNQTITDDDAASDAARGREQRTAERGVRGLVAFAILLVVSGIGGYLDMRSGAQVKGSFGIALVAGSFLAIVCVKRSAMFPIVVAPPLVYFGAAATVLYARSHGLSNRSALINGAINWLVYGFPAIAGATAAVLIVAGVRMIIRK